MGHPNNRGERQAARHNKGMKRIKEDRAQHGNDHSCACFDTNGKGAVFARFADHPQICSGSCCGNQRRWRGPTLQERRAKDD